jgi:predicted GTPase
MADCVVINKQVEASNEDIQVLRQHIRQVNSRTKIIDAASPISLEKAEMIRDKRVLVIEDGPTLTHGEMKYGAGIMAAHRFGAKEIVDPRPFLKGTLVKTFETYPDIGPLLPAMGYGDKQMKDLQDTIDEVDCDVVIIGTPIDLRRVIKISKPSTRVFYDLQEIGAPTLEDILKTL